MKVSVGRIVHYVLSKENCDAINRRRTTGQSIADRISNSGQWPSWPLGAQAHIGNTATAGQIVPMIVIQVWPNEFGPDFDGVNGQAFLDGNDALWVTSVKEGTSQGEWKWPEIAK